MKKVTNYTIREKSVLSGTANLEHLYTFKDFPVFMGCVDTPQSEDIVADMTWDICKDTGIIQLQKLLPLEVLYLNQHNDGTGSVWTEHYAAFAAFLRKYNPQKVLEIGGAHDQIARNYRALDPTTAWTIVEPNPEHIIDPNITVIKAWFDDTFTVADEFDTIIHSHVFEHTYDPVAFIKHIAAFTKTGNRHIFTFPTLLPMLERKWTNCLNFEHTAFLTEDITEYLLGKYGFTILEKKYYGNPHSVFYATEKGDVPETWPLMENKYDAYKELFTNYINYHTEMIATLNAQLAKSTAPTYLFGAHIFSQTLIQFGLDTSRIVSILDNSPLKQGKRLYGTRFMVESPEVLRNAGPTNVIVKVASYHDEITKQIAELNEKTLIW